MSLPSRPRILVVEDESDIRELIMLHLKREGFEPEEATDGAEALRKIEGGGYGLYVLDWMLPQMSGLELTRVLRQSSPSVPILMVTARMEAADIVLGLEAGADDYVTKPFELPVLMARVRALLRRAVPAKSREEAATPNSEPGRFEVDGLVVDTSGHQVSCRGEAVALTPSEFKLLVGLLRNQGRVLTRQQLIDLVQGVGVAVVDRAIDTHVFGLRKRLGDCGDIIETVRGVGYRIRSSMGE